jgi:hypothetical protein
LQPKEAEKFIDHFRLQQADVGLRVEQATPAWLRTIFNVIWTGKIDYPWLLAFMKKGS